MYRIAHISDFHLRSLDADFDRAVAMVAQAHAEADHVVIAGDIVDCAEARVLAAFRASLEELGLTRAGELTIVPGNHDIFPVTLKPIPINPGRPTKNWERFCELFASSRRGLGCRRLVRGEPFPVGKVLDENVVLAAIDSTRNGCYNQLTWASGELPDHHIEAVADFFSAHPKALHKVVVMHHCPWAPLEASQNKFFPMGMAEPDSETAVNWLQWAGATLVLCGHYHNHEPEDLEKVDLGNGLTGFCAGVSGGVDNPHDRRLFHIIELGAKGRVNIVEREMQDDALR